jgi:hypothetical protein
MKGRFWLITTLLFVSALLTVGSEKGAVVSGSTTANLTCASSPTLESLAICIRNQMPPSGSERLRRAERNRTGRLARRRQADVARLVRFHLACLFERHDADQTFTDSANGRNYCVLMEVRDANSNGSVDRGWGTFIVNNGAMREISHQAPHPISDSTTEIQAITIFKDRFAQLFDGRRASGCQLNKQHVSKQHVPELSQEADAAHNTANMFHATNQELINWYGAASWNAIQWHGMEADTCPSTRRPSVAWDRCHATCDR